MTPLADAGTPSLPTEHDLPCLVTGDVIAGQTVPVSVVILTHNERDNIGPCLDSCQWCDDVHLLDSGSTDGTVEAARDRGVTAHHHPFAGFGQQRNHAIDHLPLKHRWHFHLDADERFTPDLVREVSHLLEDPDACSRRFGSFQCPSRMMFMGQWLRYSASYPTYQVRFFDSEQTRFVDFGHGQREETTAPIGCLEEPYLHFNFSKGLSTWLEKHNGYSDREAEEAVIIRRDGLPSLSKLTSSDAVTRRRAAKDASHFLRGRGLLRFLHMTLLRGGFRDGGAGLDYASMISLYERWIELKARRLERANRDDRKTAEVVADLLKR